MNVHNPKLEAPETLLAESLQGVAPPPAIMSAALDPGNPWSTHAQAALLQLAKSLRDLRVEGRLPHE
jgi:hypothetical protein